MRITYDTLENYEEAERRVRSLDFKGIVNEVDGVLYPDLSLVPTDIGGSIHGAISDHFPEHDVEITYQFARLSVEGVNAPHQVHNDLSMGQWASVLYLTDEGGTDLCTHRALGFAGQPETERELRAWTSDTNVPDAWHVDAYIPAERNKLVMYPGDWMHRSQPIGGQGTNANNNGRLVIVTFFDLA